MDRFARIFFRERGHRKWGLLGFGFAVISASFGFVNSEKEEPSSRVERYTGDVAVYAEEFREANQTIVMVLVDLPDEQGEMDGVADIAFDLQTQNPIPQIPTQMFNNATVRHSEKELQLYQEEGHGAPFMVLTMEDGEPGFEVETLRGFGLGRHGGFSEEDWPMAGFRISDAVGPCIGDGRGCSCDEESSEECDAEATGCSIGGCPASGGEPSDCGRSCAEGVTPCCCCSGVILFKACCYCLTPDE